MIKELKYFLFTITIFLSLFLTLKYYFSDSNKRNSYRSLKQIDKRILKYSENLVLLKNNTNNIVVYVKKTKNKNKKNYNFWELINNND
jgi:hypothetical protein